jgi:subtilisin family serine protease
MLRTPSFFGLLACALVASVARVTDAQTAQITQAPVQTAAPSTPSTAATSVAPMIGTRPNGAALVHMLGARAAETLAPNTGMIGALVAIPKGHRAEDYGLEPVAPGIGRLRAPAARIEDFGFAHPELRVEVAPPLHTLLDRVGVWVGADVARRERGMDGKGVMVGVADTGLDVTSPEMLDANGKSRVAWMLDLSLVPLGVHADLENKFGIADAAGGPITGGAVLSNDMVDVLLKQIASGACVETNGKKCAPSDEIGHGTHVTGIAASRGAGGKFPGIAPAADIVFVRVTRGKSDGIENDDLVRAVEFMFDRADAMKRPMVVNLSLGSDFGPHDGTFLWEQTIASHIGPDHPGRAVVAAAGHSGSILETPIHQSVRATDGATLRVPIQTQGADSGSVQVWVTLRDGAHLKVGLDGPDGEWIAPIEEGHQNGKNTSDYNAGVIYGHGLDGSPIPDSSRGAVVVWTGKWPSGTYYVTLEGSGMAEMYLQGLGDAALLLQKDPTLTQDKILALLQGGAHRFRNAVPFEDQSGPGEVDAMGALDALDQMKNPEMQLPVAAQSWLTLSSEYVPADGSTPVTAIVELRTADGKHRADFFDKNRIAPVLLLDGEPFAVRPDIVRRGPGVWFFTWKPPAGLGGSRATFGATFDGEPIVASHTVPIASDQWNAAYPSHATGSGCSVHGIGGGGERGAPVAGAVALLALAFGAAGRRRRSLRG